MSDGHLGKCKACAKNDVSKHREKNLDKIRAYDRERAKLPHRRRKAREVTKRWRADDPLRGKAHSAVMQALKSGRLKRKPCAVCAATKSIHAHHPDYSKPLLVTWLCAGCHKAVHQTKRKKK